MYLDNANETTTHSSIEVFNITDTVPPETFVFITHICKSLNNLRIENKRIEWNMVAEQNLFWKNTQEQTTVSIRTTYSYSQFIT